MLERGPDATGPGLDILVGARHTRLEIDLGSEATLLGLDSSRSRSGDEDWTDTVVGLRLQFGDRKGYQMDPANRREAFREVVLDAEEGADGLMVKPAGPNLDLIRDAAEACQVPIAAYQVSGEYAMLHAAADAGALDLEATAYESLLGIRRAGAQWILTYFAGYAAEALQSGRWE